MSEGGGLKKKDLITVRAGALTDKNLIYATWLPGLYHGNDWFQAIQKEIYFETYQKVLDRILQRPSVFVRIACLKEDADVVLGYAVLETIQKITALHWVFVKPVWRRIGLARDLVEKVDVVTHLTRKGRAAKPLGVPFNPFLIG